jgi:chitodextrinase
LSLQLRPLSLYFVLLSFLILMLQGCTASPFAGQQPSDPPPPTDNTAATAPSNLVATASSGIQVSLSWTASTDNVGVTGYMVERCIGNGCAAFVQIATTTVTSYADSGLLNSSTYGYRVRARDAKGNLSSYSNVSYVNTPKGTNSDTTPPTAPTSLAAAATSSTQVNLTWGASTDNVAVTGYFVERCAGTNCSSFAPVGVAGSSNFSDTGLSASTSYSYRVRAKDAAGNASGYSNTSSATTQAGADTTPPTAPSGLAATASSSTQISLAWTASTDSVGVTGYRVERCMGTSCTSFAQIGASTVTSFSDSGLTASTSYSYRVRATDAAGHLSGYSNTASAATKAGADVTLPTAPTNLVATASSSTQIGLTWTASTDNVGVTAYRVERCTGANCTSFTQIGSTGAITFSNSGLTASTSYSYRVRATDAAGNLSNFSNTSSATTQAASDTTPPTPPTALAATASSSTQVGLTWTASTDNVGVTAYRVERCTGTGCTSFAQIATSTVTSFSDSGRTASTSYSYRVRATDAAGNLSNYSNTAPIITLSGPDTKPPTAPSSLVATASSSTQIGLTWTASTDNVGVTGYRIERCTGASCTSFTQIGTTGGTTFSNSGLTASTSYSYRVRATDAAGNLSNFSNTSSATTQAGTDTTPPTAPASLVATAASSTQIGLKWTASTDNVGVTGYRIERCTGASCTSFTQIGTTGGTTFSNSGLTASTSYSYRVRATDAAGNLSVFSNTSSATTSSSGGSNITVSISPKRGGLTVSQTHSFTATLTNDSGNQGVTWSSSGGGSFLPTTSTSGNAVTFTAPASAGVVTITATAVADSAKTATATIGVTDLVGVFTYHNGLSRDGANTKEYALTTGNIATASFGKLFSCQADGAIYAQPLWVSHASIGGGTHNVVVVATMHDSVYVFDADANPCVTYWSKHLLPAGETWGTYADTGSSDIFPDIGILGTPVIDPSTHAIYLVTKSKNASNGNYVQRLHALNLADGSERSGSPVSIDSNTSVSGTCDGGTSISFNALRENQRPGLALINGVVYVAWASHGDVDPYHGWVIGYNASSLARTALMITTPNTSTAASYCRGGIWMSGAAPAADSSNNIYLMTGNGLFDANTGGSNYSNSYLKLSTSLAVSDYFTPHNQMNLDGGDTDVGSGGTALLIDQAAGPVAHLLVGAGKSGTFYMLNRDNMGHFNASTDAAAVQTWVSSGRSFSTPAFWNNSLYYFGVKFGNTQPGEQYTFNTSSGQFNTTPIKTAAGLGFPGATPSVSSSGTSNGVLWALDTGSYGTNNNQSAPAGPAVLHAYSAADINTELWNSKQGKGNAAGFAVKFAVPTVANGKVYIGTRGNDTTNGPGTVFGELDVYGLLP